MARKDCLRFILTWLVLGVIPLLLRPLWQPDEGRYAEIPREMLATGDWLTPHLNYVLYFEKPPFQYWVSAIFMKLFSESAFVARLPLALAAFLTMYAVWRLAKRLGSDRPTWASFAAMSCLLLYACGQILTLDALFSALCVFSLAALIEAVSLRCQGGATPKIVGWTLAFFIGLGCALLTKGPVVIVLIGGATLFSLYFAWADAKLRTAVLRTIFSPYGLIAFAAVSVPWFVMVNNANPGHAHFFFYTEHFERFTTHKHARQGSDNPILDKLYFVPVILAGLLPWLSACFVGAKRAIKFLRSKGPATYDAPLNKWVIAVLLAAFAWPIIFFSASGSKLIPYVMPCIVPIIAIAVAFEKDSDGFLPFRRMGAEILVLGGVFLLAAMMVLFSPAASNLAKWMTDFQNSGGGLWVLFLGLWFVILGLWAIKGKGLTATRWMAYHAALLVTLTIAAQRINGPISSIDHLVASAPKEKIQWISHGNYFQALPFLVKDRITVVGATGELRYGKDRLEPAEQDRWFIEDRSALTETGRRLHLERPDVPVWALSDRRAWDSLAPESQAAWELVNSSRKTVVLRFIPSRNQIVLPSGL